MNTYILCTSYVYVQCIYNIIHVSNNLTDDDDEYGTTGGQTYRRFPPYFIRYFIYKLIATMSTVLIYSEAT